MNKALFLTALFLSLAVGPPLGAGSSQGTVGGVPGELGAHSGAGSQMLPAAEPLPRQESSAFTPGAATQTRFGTQNLAYQSLIHRDRARPGVISEWQPHSQTAMRGFVFHPEIKEARSEAAKSSDSQQQLFGVVAEHTLPLGSGETLKVTGGWISVSELADSKANPAAPSRTLAWSLGADASLFEGRLQLALEQAGSSTEEGSGASAGSRAEAHRVRAEWQADSARKSRWRFATEYSWVGPDFDSVASDGVRADRERLRSEGDLDIDAWRFRLSAQRERDNLVHDPSRRTDEVDRYQITTTWSPSDYGSDWVLGRPRLTLAAEFGHDQRFLPFESGSEVSPYHRLRFESEFRTSAGRWGLKAARGQNPGAIDSSQRWGIDVAQLELYRDQRSFQPFPVTSRLQWQQRQDRMTGTQQDRWQLRMGSKPIAMHERLGADFDLRYRHQVQSNTRVPQKDLQLAGRLVWTVDRPTSERSGLALALSADYRERHSASRRDDEGYRLLLMLSSSHPYEDW